MKKIITLIIILSIGSTIFPAYGMADEHATDTQSAVAADGAFEHDTDGINSKSSIVDIAIADGNAQNSSGIQSTNYIEVDSYIGANRYHTQISDTGSDSLRAPGLVIATGANHADAVVASGLAGALGYRFLYVDLQGNTWLESELANHRAPIEHVVIVGGASAVPTSVEKQLQSLLPDAGIERIWGSTRYSTSRAVWNYGQNHGVWSDTAVVVSGSSWADGASCAGLAAYLHAPVFFADARGRISDDDVQVLSNFSVVLVGGGSLVVSEDSVGEISSTTEVKRLWGSDRYGTNASIAIYELTLSDDATSGGMAFSVTEGSAELFFVSGKTYADCIPLMVNSAYRVNDSSSPTKPRSLVIMQNPGHYAAVVDAFGMDARSASGLEPISPKRIVFVGMSEWTPGTNTGLLNKLCNEQHLQYVNTGN